VTQDPIEIARQQKSPHYDCAPDYLCEKCILARALIAERQRADDVELVARAIHEFGPFAFWKVAQIDRWETAQDEHMRAHGIPKLDDDARARLTGALQPKDAP
jgi:hypothetical protein